MYSLAILLVIVLESPPFKVSAQGRLMAVPGDTQMGGSNANFPTNRWSLLGAVGDEMSDEHRQALSFLIERYWKPVYCYIRRRGYGNEEAKDLVQEFFTFWLARNLFGRADSAKGRFRSFLLASVGNFLKNHQRAQHALKRRPPEGVVSIEDLVRTDGLPPDPGHNETPDAAFFRSWVSEVLRRALDRLERAYKSSGRHGEFELFRIRIIEPALTGSAAPPMSDLAEKLGLTAKQASNRLVTARRAYQRLLREEIAAVSATDEDVAAEMQDIYRFVAGE